MNNSTRSCWQPTSSMHSGLTRCIPPTGKPASEVGGQGRVNGYAPKGYTDYEGGLFDIGFAGEGFAFDNELPRHPVYLRPFQLASRLISCAEYLQFMEDDGYRRPELWLAEGWNTVETQRWEAPLYWSKHEGRWHIYTMVGDLPLADLLQTPVYHVSYFEADAFARWAGKAAAQRSGMGGRGGGLAGQGQPAGERLAASASLPGGPDRRSGANLWRCMGVDAKSLRGVSGISRPAGRPGRIQRKIHVQPDGIARRIGGDTSLPYPRQLP